MKNERIYKQKKRKSIHLIRKFKGIENAIMEKKYYFKNIDKKKVSPGGMKKGNNYTVLERKHSVTRTV